MTVRHRQRFTLSFDPEVIKSARDAIFPMPLSRFIEQLLIESLENKSKGHQARNSLAAQTNAGECDSRDISMERRDR